MRRALILIVITLLLASNVGAQNICPLEINTPAPKGLVSLAAFEKLPILEDGRLKPLDTYARNLLLQLSGKRTFNGEGASAWLIKMIFAPQHVREDKVFLINNPDIPSALGIEEQEKRRYSFAQLQGHIEQIQDWARAAEKIDKKDRDVVESEILRLFHNLVTFSELSLTFSFTFPHNDFAISDPQLKETLGFPASKVTFSFIDIALKAGELSEVTSPMENLPAAQWNAQQQGAIALVNSLFQWSQLYQQLPVHIIPSYFPQDENWYSPWDAIAIGLQLEPARNEASYLNEMVIAYWKGEQITFDVNAKLFKSSLKGRSPLKEGKKLNRLSIEYIYNKLDLLFYAQFIYLFALFLFFTSLMRPGKFLYSAGSFFTVTAFFLHSLALIMRIIILQRPPVSNLYETFIFVGFISAIAGLVIERVNKQWLGLVIASISGYIFLTIASKFSMEGDTLQMLIAVLNSNFWLSTHVISITIGYSGVCVAGIVGHVYILQSIFAPKNTAQLHNTYRILLGTLGFGLTMTFLGTNLGGIWADQSWGRFWGWDPKENGALLIILWTALLFHAKVGKMIGPLGLAVGAACGIVVVMWAWFGVNLLSIGLHSYGFTAGLAMNLTIYFILQVLFLSIAGPIAKGKQIK